MNFKFRKLITAVFLAFGLVLSVPTLFSVLGIADTALTVSAEETEGWNTDSTGKYYVKDGEKLTGLQKIGKYKYYFGSDGYMVTGPVKIGNTVYYFRMDTGYLRTGISGLWKNKQGTYYYLNAAKDGSLITSSWVVHNGKYYYADKEGTVRFGTLKIGSKMYHITKSGRLTGYKKSSYNGKYYYADSTTGALKTGLQKINNKLYYFSPSNGVRLTGEIKSGKYTYYFDTTKAYAKKGWLNLNGKYYYHDSNGRRVTGFITLNSKTFYFNPNQNGARLENGWYKIGSYYYYFNSSGVVQKGLIRVGNKLYYANANGQRQTGWQTINGKRYFFSRANDNAAKTGSFTYNGKQYYCNPTTTSSNYCVAVTGMTKIGNYWYYYGSDYARQTGWVTYNLRKYYFDPTTGRMLTGSHYINGTLYHFGVSGGISVNTSSISGSWSIKVNRKQCFVVVYKGSTPVKAFVCSTSADGVSTPTGYFSILDKLRWHELNGPSWGQYCSHITQSILFHSVPCSQYRNPYSLKASYYNKLGSPASAGCIRLTVEHAKWLYDFCPVGTSVYISDYVAKPTGIEIEQAPKIPLTQTYDPTDPNLWQNIN